MESDAYASKAYPVMSDREFDNKYRTDDINRGQVMKEPKRAGEIFGLVVMLKSAVDDLEKSVSIHRERIEPIRSARSVSSQAEPSEKRAFLTPLGGELVTVLDRLYSLRNRIDETTTELEI